MIEEIECFDWHAHPMQYAIQNTIWNETWNQNGSILPTQTTNADVKFNLTWDEYKNISLSVESAQ